MHLRLLWLLLVWCLWWAAVEPLCRCSFRFRHPSFRPPARTRLARLRPVSPLMPGPFRCRTAGPLPNPGPWTPQHLNPAPGMRRRPCSLRSTRRHGTVASLHRGMVRFSPLSRTSCGIVAGVDVMTEFKRTPVSRYLLDLLLFWAGGLEYACVCAADACPPAILRTKNTFVV